jgi:hypothetical protein
MPATAYRFSAPPDHAYPPSPVMQEAAPAPARRRRPRSPTTLTLLDTLAPARPAQPEQETGQETEQEPASALERVGAGVLSAEPDSAGGLYSADSHYGASDTGGPGAADSPAFSLSAAGVLAPVGVLTFSPAAASSPALPLGMFPSFARGTRLTAPTNLDVGLGPSVERREDADGADGARLSPNDTLLSPNGTFLSTDDMRLSPDGVRLGSDGAPLSADTINHSVTMTFLKGMNADAELAMGVDAELPANPGARLHDKGKGKAAAGPFSTAFSRRGHSLEMPRVNVEGPRSVRRSMSELLKIGFGNKGRRRRGSMSGLVDAEGGAGEGAQENEARPKSASGSRSLGFGRMSRESLGFGSVSMLSMRRSGEVSGSGESFGRVVSEEGLLG